MRCSNCQGEPQNPVFRQPACQDTVLVFCDNYCADDYFSSTNRSQNQKVPKRGARPPC